MIDRVTLIHPDGTDEHRITRDVDTYTLNTISFVKVPLHLVPDWEGKGMDVVAATKEGHVVAAFTVSSLSTIEENPQMPINTPIMAPNEMPVKRYRVYRETY